MLDWAPLCKNQFWYFQLISSCVSNATFGFLQSKSKSAFISFDEFEFKVPLSQPIKLLFEFILGYIIYNPSQVNQDIFVLWAFASGAKSWDLQRKYMSYIRTHLKKKQPVMNVSAFLWRNMGNMSWNKVLWGHGQPSVSARTEADTGHDQFRIQELV